MALSVCSPKHAGVLCPQRILPTAHIQCPHRTPYPKPKAPKHHRVCGLEREDLCNVKRETEVKSQRNTAQPESMMQRAQLGPYRKGAESARINTEGREQRSRKPFQKSTENWVQARPHCMLQPQTHSKVSNHYTKAKNLWVAPSQEQN